MRTLVTGRFEPIPLPQTFEPVANLVRGLERPLRGRPLPRSGRLDRGHALRRGLLAQAYPASTAPGIFDHFDLDFDSVVTHSFTPIEQFEALARIRRTVRQMGAADDDAASLRGQLIDAADDLASGRISFGLRTHASIAVFARDEEIARRRGGGVRAGQRAGCVLVREDIGARSTGSPSTPAIRATAPGRRWSRRGTSRTSPRCTRHREASTPTGRRGRGGDDPSDCLLERLPLQLPSRRQDRRTHRRPHAGARPDRLGQTLGTAFLIAQAPDGLPRHRLRQDRGLEMPVRAMGGTTAPCGSAKRRGSTVRGRDRRPRSGVARRLAGGDALARGPLTAIQSQALTGAVAANAETDPGLRTLASFRRQFRSVDDDGALHDRMGDWDGDGSFGWLFSAPASTRSPSTSR